MNKARPFVLILPNTSPSKRVEISLFRGGRPIEGAKLASLKFPNCDQLNKVFLGGLRGKNTFAKGEVVSVSPSRSASLYSLNAALDSDQDGIACER